MTSAEPLLSVDGLRTHFDTRRGVVHAVNGVSFSIGRGELVGLVGETGCGKSVTARSIIGLVRPPGRIVEGVVHLEGRQLPLASNRDLRDIRGVQIGFIPQNPFGALNPILRIEVQFRNVIRAHRRISKEDCRQMAFTMLERVGIAGPNRVLAGYAHQLSGGMAQRVVIAIALVLHPQLVIADEPTTGLDVTVQRQILDLIMELLDRDQRAMLLVTHDLGVVAQYCHRVVVMYAGKVVEVGEVASVFKEPAHPYTQALLRAIPRVGEKLASLTGAVPNLIDYPPGCPFRDRCDYESICPRPDQEPELHALRLRREVACHLPEGVTARADRSS